MYEDAGDGAGLIWFTIMGLVPGEVMYAIGHTAPPYGGPATGLLQFTFEKIDEHTTRFKLTDSSFGHLAASDVGNAEKGWKMLFAELKTHVEK